jgi:viroplasmin and RNaseH domain-containing protein
MNYNEYPSKGIDHKIKLIQNALNLHLGFDNVDFYGRVQKVLAKDGKSFVPEVHISNKERKGVFYDDRNAAGGNVFFVDDDNHTSKVFMLNLNKCFTNTNYRADSEVQDICVKLVEKIKALEVTGIEKGLKNVLKDFNIENIKLNDLQPYHTFSINGDLKYTFNSN